jgi:hypothetical protein
MSTTFAQLTADVLTIVKRPDLMADIVLHSKNAILKAHSADYWKQDLFESAFSFAQPAVLYTLDKTSLLSRWKKLSYLSTLDPSTMLRARDLEIIDVLLTRDSYGYLRDYVAYEAGSNLQIRCSDSPQYFNLGVYLYPDVTLQNPSWIVDNFEFAVVYEAARTLFKSIGYDAQSNSMESLVAEAMAEVRMADTALRGE